MQLPVVLDGEQIAMRQQECQADRIFPQPDAGDENRALIPLSTSAMAMRSSNAPGQASRVKAIVG
jgi:hypothetical protein